MQNLLHLTKNRAVLKCIRQTAVGSGCCLTLRRAICGMSIGAQKAMYCQKFQSQRQLIEVIKIKEAYNQLTWTQYIKDKQMILWRLSNYFFQHYLSLSFLLLEYSSEGNERPSYKNCRSYLNNTLDPTDTDWVRFNSTTYMARYAYVISPLSDKIRLVVASGGGPMLKYIVTEDDFRYVTTTMNKGEQLTYVLILANANKRGIQKLELAFERK